MWDYYHVVVAHGSGSITCIFHHGKPPLINRKPFFKHLSCKVKWKADLCSSVKHHLCWHGCADLCWAGRIQQTRMKRNTPLMDICRGSLTPKCQHGYRLPLFFSLQSRERGDAGSLLESPRSSTCACIIHGLATTHTHTHTANMIPGKQEHYSSLWKDDCMFEIKWTLFY